MTSQNDSKNEQTKWAVLNTHPHKEHIACENLIRQAFLPYCPMVRRVVKHARRAREVLRPLFPGYLFVRLDFTRQRWRPILSTAGVKTLVRFGDRPGAIDDQFVESLRAREVDGAIVQPDKPYSLDQQVQMIGGPFEGTVAKIIALDEKDRLIVLMELMNRTVKVATEVDKVSALR